MATAIVDGLATRYETLGSGPPLLMLSPAGFDATLDKWRTQGIYAKLKLLDHLPRRYTCIVFDRRETGASDGRVERLSWAHYVRQAKGLLEHLGYARAHVLGGCMGCSVAIAFGAAHPEATQSLVLYWPVGGAKYRMSSHLRFARHLAYVAEHGLEAVVALVRSHDKSFGEDPRGGPWAAPIRRDAAFAEAYARADRDRYATLVEGTSRALFDRDTSPGAEPEDLLRLDVPALIVPGRDASHATSAARYLEECLPRAEYWDVAVGDQTETDVPPRVLSFLDAAG